MDLLSDVLRDLRLESAVLSLSELRAPWGLDKGTVGGAPFYIAIEGHCVIEVDDGVPTEVAAGDLVVLPHGTVTRSYRRRAPRARRSGRCWKQTVSAGPGRQQCASNNCIASASAATVS